MSTDLARVGALEGRDAVSNAETMRLDNSHNAAAANRSQASFRRAAGAVVGALRFDAVASTAQQRGQWAVQPSPAREGSTADQVLVRVQAAVSRSLVEMDNSAAYFELVGRSCVYRMSDVSRSVSTACRACSTPVVVSER